MCQHNKQLTTMQTSSPKCSEENADSSAGTHHPEGEIKDSKVYFPTADGVCQEALIIDKEGKYSISRPDQAQATTDLVIAKARDLGLYHKTQHIIDATAGWGGNTLNFSENFGHVFAMERNIEHFQALTFNLRAYGLDEGGVTLMHTDCMEAIRSGSMRATLCFADPPWSQPGLQWYKEETEWPLFLSDRPLAEDVTEILTDTSVKLFVLKIPANFAIEAFIGDLPKKYVVRMHSVYTYKVLLIFRSQTPLRTGLNRCSLAVRAFARTIRNTANTRFSLFSRSHRSS